MCTELRKYFPGIECKFGNNKYLITYVDPESKEPKSFSFTFSQERLEALKALCKTIDEIALEEEKEIMRQEEEERTRTEKERETRRHGAIVRKMEYKDEQSRPRRNVRDKIRSIVLKSLSKLSDRPEVERACRKHRE